MQGATRKIGRPPTTVATELERRQFVTSREITARIEATTAYLHTSCESTDARASTMFDIYTSLWRTYAC